MEQILYILKEVLYKYHLYQLLLLHLRLCRQLPLLLPARVHKQSQYLQMFPKEIL
ncbi:hypothetical protein X975_01778, partial [Stegodyphus mimosarum]